MKIKKRRWGIKFVSLSMYVSNSVQSSPFARQLLPFFASILAKILTFREESLRLLQHRLEKVFSRKQGYLLHLQYFWFMTTHADVTGDGIDLVNF